MQRSENAPGVERERLAAVSSTGLDATSDPTMDRLAGLVQRLLGADVALVSLVDDRRQFFPGQHGLRDPWSVTRETPLSQSICRLVVESGAPVQVDDTATDDRLVGHGARPVLGVGSYLGVPLSDVDGNVLGSLCAIGGEARTWTDDDRRLLADLGYGASSELRARIAASVATRATERVQLIADASEALNASLDAEVALAGMLDAVVPALAAWAVVWARPTPLEGPQVLSRPAGDAAVERMRAAMAGEPAGTATGSSVEALLGEPAPRLVAPDEAAATLAGLVGTRDAATLAARGVLVVPVVDRAERMGVLALGPAPGAAGFAAVDVALAADLGRRAGSSLRNARAYGHERSVATTLQRSLLPSLATVAGLEVGGRYEPGSTGAEVGGDWYDVMAQADGSVAVTVGDVTGHSMDAAATMGRLASAIGCYAHDGLGPAAIVSRLDGLRHHLLGDLFATCICLRMRPHPDGWAVTVSNAGHLPPILAVPGEGARLLAVPGGALVGPYEAPSRQEGEAFLPWGALLLLYTDGLVEQRTEMIHDSVERLRAAVGGLDLAAPVDDLCGTLVAELRPDGTDDVAVLCLRAAPAVS